MATRRLRTACSALLVWATCAAALAADPGPKADGSAVRQAVAAHDYRRAAIELNTLVAQRLPASDKAGPDPVLDRFFAELISINGAPATAMPLLLRITADPKARDRGHYRLLLGAAQEDAGQLTDAERVYQSVSADRETSSEDRIGGAVGYARLRMMTSPEEALAALRATPPTPAHAWEVDLQRARAESLAGRDEAAQAALQSAWNEALMAGPDESAAARTAADMMVAAGRKGDRNRLITLLAVDRLNRGINTGQEVLSANLPLCGAAGIGPDDSIAVQFVRQAPPGRPRFSLIWASRPGIAAPFLAAIARYPDFHVQDGQAAAVILRCRLAPAADYRVRARLDDQILSWTSSRGAYPLIDTGDQSDTSSLASTLAERERRYGVGSVMVLPVLIRILQSTGEGGADNQEARTRAAALSHRIADIVATDGGPADVVLLSRLSAAALDVAAQKKSVTDAQTDFGDILAAAARNPAVSLDTLYALVSEATAYAQAPSTLRAQLLEQTIAVLRAREPKGDPRVTAMGLRLLGVRVEQGDNAAAADLIRQYGFAPDLCSVAVPPVRFTSSNITGDDYPADLVQTLLQGRTMLEFSIGPSGAATATRILVSDPPFAFDAIALAKSSTLIYEPAKTAGVARTCRGQLQPIRWQLPY